MPLNGVNVMNDSHFTLRQQIRSGSAVNMSNTPEQYDRALYALGAAATDKEDGINLLKALGFISYPVAAKNLYNHTVDVVRDGNPAIDRYREKRGIK